MIGGFLVGVGTRMALGCTAGHAICGIPRMSKRSITATAIFLPTAIIIATLRTNLGPAFMVGDSKVENADFKLVHYVFS